MPGIAMTQNIAQVLQSRVASGLPASGLPLIGLNSHQRSLFTDAQNVSMLSAMGAKIARIDVVNWQTVEKSRGQFDFAGSSALVAGLRAKAIKINWLLTYNNPIYCASGGLGAVVTQANIDGYVAYCLATLKQYWKPGDIIELWNEPNLGQFWSPTASAAQYATLMTQAAAQIRAAYPTATIVTAGFSDSGGPNGWTPYLTAVAAVGPFANINGVAFHPYNQGDLVAQYPEFEVTNYAAVQAIFNGLPLHITEKGYPLAWASNSETRKAILNARSVLTSIIMGAASHIHYDLVDDGADQTNTENTYGLYSSALAMLPSGVAMMALNAALTYVTSYSISYDAAQCLLWLTLVKPTGITVIAWTYLRPSNNTTPVNFSAAVAGSTVTSCKDLFGSSKPFTLSGGVLSMILTEDAGPVVVSVAA